jgi:hypothetical protein
MLYPYNGDGKNPLEPQTGGPTRVAGGATCRAEGRGATMKPFQHRDDKCRVRLITDGKRREN